MRWQGSYPLACACALFTALNLSGSAFAAPQEANWVHDDGLIVALRQDADLLDVDFVDQRHGWAVGNHGAIWHTTDGGQQWQLQESGVRCGLTSVCFLDANTGWAAGGFTHPYTHVTTGVLLRTHDGGTTWVRWQRAPLPALLKVQFFDMKQGWAIGQPSSLFPHGVFSTDDGGRTWTPVSLSAARTWLSGDFVDPRHGAVAGQNGVIAAVRNRAVVSSRNQFHGLQSLKCMAMQNTDLGYAVGDGGLVVATHDGGTTWQSLAENMPAAGEFDFSAVATHGSNVWIAGSPGTRVYHSMDHGKHWSAEETGQALPLRALSFVDAVHGWATGSLGSIWATGDGGRTWRLQRSGGRRAAVLAVFADSNQVPLEMLARLSAGEGYLSAISLIGRHDLDSPPRGHDIRWRREGEALVSAGAGIVDQAWKFPLFQSGLNLPADQIVNRWTAMNKQPAMELLEQYIVRQIQTWRPDVIVTVAASPRDEDPLAQLVNQSVLRAVKRAGQPPADGLAGNPLGLASWQVSKIYAVLPPRTVGTASITTSQLIPSLGRSLADYVTTPRSLLSQHHQPAPATLRFQLLQDYLPQGQGRRDFFSGLQLQPGSEARRQYVRPRDVDIGRLKRAANRSQVVRAIVASAGRDRQDTNAWLGQINQVIGDLDSSTAGEVLFHLASRYHQEGHWPKAAETFELLVKQYPQHPLVGRSMQWLIQYYASGEAYCRNGARQPPAIRQVRADLPESKPFFVAPPEAKNAKPTPESQDPESRRLSLAAQWTKRLQSADLMLHADPTVQFPLAAALRTSGQLRQAARVYLSRQRSAQRNAWWYCAESERALLEERSKSEVTTAAKPSWICRRSQEKPLLDGQLKEALWTDPASANAELPGGRIQLGSAYRDDESWPAHVLTSYDSEYLYFGIRCRKAAGVDYAVDDKPRVRDANLDTKDRVDILIDIDRDFATYYRLTIDYRGWTSDSCWNDISWNPEWYVAASSTQSTWTCELAIPLAQLTKRPHRRPRLWAVGVQRIVPGVGFQSWTHPASTTISPEGFGYLQFE